MSSVHLIRRFVVLTGGSALACMAVLAAASNSQLAAESGRIDAP